MAKTINIIGAGRLGKTIAKLITEAKTGEIQCLLNSSFASGQKAREFIGCGEVCAEISELKPANIYLITTPDDSIEKICNLLVNQHTFKNHTIVVHCSGALSSEVLQKAKNIGCFTASIHPIKSFADSAKSIKSFSGTFCVYEGDKGAFTTIAAIFESIGGKLFTIDKNDKPLYHVAGVFCCNYLITLSHIANECYKKAGIPEKIAKQITRNLMQNALENLQIMPPNQALTGPIARADLNILKKHQQALENLSALKHLYAELGKQIILLTKHDDKLKQQLNRLLEMSIP